MPFSDELRKCPWCKQHENWRHMIWKNGQMYCQSCYIEYFGDKEEEKSNEKDEVSI